MTEPTPSHAAHQDRTTTAIPDGEARALITRGGPGKPRLRPYTGPGPCAACELAQRCKAERLACGDFERWVAYGGTPKPSRFQRTPGEAAFRRIFAVDALQQHNPEQA
jgi:hypothetical protein